MWDYLEAGLPEIQESTLLSSGGRNYAVHPQQTGSLLDNPRAQERSKTASPIFLAPKSIFRASQILA